MYLWGETWLVLNVSQCCLEFVEFGIGMEEEEEEERCKRYVRFSFPAGPEGSNCVWMCACHGLSLGGETLRLQTPMVGFLGESALILPLWCPWPSAPHQEANEPVSALHRSVFLSLPPCLSLSLSLSAMQLPVQGVRSVGELYSNNMGIAEIAPAPSGFMLLQTRFSWRYLIWLKRRQKKTTKLVILGGVVQASARKRKVVQSKTGAHSPQVFFSFSPFSHSSSSTPVRCKGLC